MASHKQPLPFYSLWAKSKQSRKISYIVEVVETQTFWCSHVDRAGCTNFSPRTIELQPCESQDILPFPFLISPFPSFFSLRTVFLLFSFCFSIIFLFSHLISSSFWSTPLIRSKEEVSSLFPQAKCVALDFPLFFFYSFL